jgi:hypothetical protein
VQTVQWFTSVVLCMMLRLVYVSLFLYPSLLPRDAHYPEGVKVAPSLQAALDLAAVSSSPRIEGVFVIGGVAPIVQALAHPDCAAVYHTQLHAEFECDVCIPSLLGLGFEVVSSQVRTRVLLLRVPLLGVWLPLRV